MRWLLLTIMSFMIIGCFTTPIRKDDPVPPPQPPKVEEPKPHKKLIVAIIDTGYGYKGKGSDKNLCKSGHIDLTKDAKKVKIGKEEVPEDRHGHGTNIAGTIEKYAEGGDYCLVIIKYFSPTDKSSGNVLGTIKAINYARLLKADVINISLGGKSPNDDEKALVKLFLDTGGKIFAAAGNDAKLLTDNYFPALYDERIVVVGNEASTEIKDGEIIVKPADTSNYGPKVTQWEHGVQEAYGIELTGTSQSTAVATGKFLSKNVK